MTARASSDDVVLQTADDRRVVVPIFHTPSGAAGAAAAYMIRRIAYRAGCYAPGIHEAAFFQLNTHQSGKSLDAVQAWFTAYQAELHDTGYRLHARRLAERTGEIVGWVGEGKGMRAALLPVPYAPLHTGELDIEAPELYTVGIAVERRDGSKRDETVMVDPWPGRDRDLAEIPEALHDAHRSMEYKALLFYWAGWS